ncbi:cryptochrome/photolyase family protein [Magnetospirillum molischianum]|uniref:Deoxyribodipyrimidine photo-lyase n=1 Tax=Magnetospirillum molischianum DSM 120 TaxID=1150626 RepID=H8FVZ1_MAGML|nr:deoxyribodipyrimidine photo-lyase [Magnetospirillum molischianum]CCG42529.1 Deoxyribodipyrimidine photo-lyase (DNA photolyase) (Photoreactivating enzyme) [Magnetospirillum molischianum DSM 120]
MTRPAIVWFRRDLRLADNPALVEAAASGQPLIPLFIDETGVPEGEADGGATRWWLHHSLLSLGRDLAARGVPLLLRRGEPLAVLEALVAATGATRVLWNRRYTPRGVVQDTTIKAALTRHGIEVRSFKAGLLFEPWEIATRSGTPFRVFTPFWRSCLAAPPPDRPLPPPAALRPCESVPPGDDLGSWRLLPTAPDWAGGLNADWQPGEAGAEARLQIFLDQRLKAYAVARDLPGQAGTSRLSPHLAFGEISPRRAFHAARDAAGSGNGLDRFLAELGWREFCAHLLFTVPDLPEQPLRGEFAAFPWRDDPELLVAWQRGRTGFPLVDAGMRELWTTGWMHNRVRMVVASFLVKDLLLSWRLGADWFRDTLVDADLASNVASWQWVAGCGADAAPFFRIFNPTLQGEKFDPDGRYVRRWCPELAGLPDRWLHQPGRASDIILRQAGVSLGRSYPHPIVDHDVARRRALAAMENCHGGEGSESR